MPRLHIIQLIAQRDFWAIVQTRSFLLGLLAFVFVASIMPGVALLSMLSDEYRIGVIDPLGPYRRELAAELKLEKEQYAVQDLTPAGGSTESAAREAHEALRRKELFAVVEVLRPAPAGAEETFRINTTSLSDPIPQGALERALLGILRRQRAQRLGISPEQLEILTAPIQTRTLQVTASTEPREATRNDFTLAVAMPIIFVFSLFGLISFQSERLLTALLEEKMKRLLEVILTRASIYELLLGKMLGILYVGLLLYAGVSVLLLMGAWLLGALTLLSLKHFLTYTLFYIAGYVLYAGFYASIGAACTNPKDAENLSMPLRMLLMIPIMISIYVSRNPEAPATIFFSFLPLTAPFVMVNRANVSSVPWWEIGLSAALVLTAGAAGLWVAARLFRASLLLQGRNLRWADLRLIWPAARPGPSAPPSVVS